MVPSGSRSRLSSRWALLAFLILLLAPAGLLQAQGIVFQETEPNDSEAEANILPLDNLSLRGIMDFKGDLDYYQFNLVEGNLVRVFATGFVGAFEGRIQILNAAGVVLAEVGSRDDASPSTMVVNVLITAASPPGIGYLRVSNDIQNNTDSPVAYNAQLSTGVGEIEPNDTPAEAQLLDEVFPVLATFPSQENITEDFYTFSTTLPDQTLVLSMEYPLTVNLDMRMELQDDAGEVILAIDRTNISGSGGLKNPSMVFLLPDAATYFVRIYNPGQVPGLSFTINYTLFFGLEEGLFEQEPNQSFSEAVRLIVPPGETGIVISGLLQSGLDVDLYRVDVPGGFVLISDVDTTSEFGVMDGVTSAFVEEALGVSFASNDNSSLVPAGASFALINRDPYLRVVPPRGGTVVLGVADRQNFGGPQGFEYNLKVKVLPALPGESEPNDLPGSERQLTSGETIRGTIGVSGDVDRFAISGQAGETLLVNLNGFGIGSFLDARVILKDSQETVLVDQSLSAFSLDPFILIPSLPADDDYIIQVQIRQGVAGFGVSYFYELSASLSTSIQTVVADPDVDGSGRVDGFDLAVVSRIFGSSAGDPDFLLAADLIRDGNIDGEDLAALGNFFGSEVNFAGSASLLVDTRGDDLPFFGPATDTADLLGLGTVLNGTALSFTVFFADEVTGNTGGVISIDTDASGLTGSLGTPDAYVAEQSLGSELELFFDSNSVNLFAIPDPRGGIYPAFRASVGDVDAAVFPVNPSQRNPLLPVQVGSEAATSSGSQINFEVDISNLGGTAQANAAALALSIGDVEPTDRLPNRGKVSLQLPPLLDAIMVSQRVCDDDRRLLCDVDGDCGTTCVDLDSLPPDSIGGAPIPFGSRMVYLRTQAGGPIYTDVERSFLPLSDADTGKLGSRGPNNDLLGRVFPFGVHPIGGASDPFVEWFTRDMLYNFGFRDAGFDPHVIPGGQPPPDVDLYYFVGGEGDRAIVDVVTADQGATFNSMLELFRIPLSLSALDPTSPASTLPVAEDDLTLIATNDDKPFFDPNDPLATNLDPRIEIILDATSIYVVRVSASPTQTVFPGTMTTYSIYHESLRPDEISIPIIARGTFSGPGVARVTGLQINVDFDPSVVSMTGIDIAQGLRVLLSTGDRHPATAQEYVAERVVDDPGRIRVAIRSYRDGGFQTANGLQGDGLFNINGFCFPCPEIVVARLRFRAVGAGSTTIEIAPNPTNVGERLLNLGLGPDQDGPIWQPTNGYGPGIQVTVTAPAP